MIGIVGILGWAPVVMAIAAVVTAVVSAVSAKNQYDQAQDAKRRQEAFIAKQRLRQQQQKKIQDVAIQKEQKAQLRAVGSLTMNSKFRAEKAGEMARDIRADSGANRPRYNLGRPHIS